MNELYHHGIKGQKWGVRRYQNKDGSYTYEGTQRRKIKDLIKRPSQNAVYEYSYNTKQATDNTVRALDAQAIASNPKYRPGYRELMQEASDHHKKLANSYTAKAITTLEKNGRIRFSKEEDFEIQRGEARVKQVLDKYANQNMERYVNTEKDKPHKKGSDEELGAYSASDLMKKIEKEAGDWYNGKGVGSNFTKALNDIHQFNNSKRSNSAQGYRARINAQRKLYDNLVGAALKDMGYKDTEENRQYLLDMGVIFWD